MQIPKSVSDASFLQAMSIFLVLVGIMTAWEEREMLGLSFVAAGLACMGIRIAAPGAGGPPAV